MGHSHLGLFEFSKKSETTDCTVLSTQTCAMTVIKKLRRDFATLAHYHLCDGHNNQIIKTEKAENQGDDKGTVPIKKHST